MKYCHRPIKRCPLTIKGNVSGRRNRILNKIYSNFTYKFLSILKEHRRSESHPTKVMISKVSCQSKFISKRRTTTLQKSRTISQIFNWTSDKKGCGEFFFFQFVFCLKIAYVLWKEPNIYNQPFIHPTPIYTTLSYTLSFNDTSLNP